MLIIHSYKENNPYSNNYSCNWRKIKYNSIPIKINDLIKFCKDYNKWQNIVQFSTVVLMKAYPQRFDSINYDPTKVWLCGGHVAALNIQSLNLIF